MVAVTVVHSSLSSARPPLLLVHGAANSAAVWQFWQQELAGRGYSSYAVDLRGHGKSSGSVDGATMADYADDVIAIADEMPETPAVMGWSMGGLVAMLVAASGRVKACVGLAPSVPATERDDRIAIRRGVFGPEEYGIASSDPAQQSAMPDLDTAERRIALKSSAQESRMARDERKAGIVITALPCPLLVVTGSQDENWPRSSYSNMPLPADYMETVGASHWGLVLNRRLLPALADRVTGWLEEKAGEGTA